MSLFCLPDGVTVAPLQPAQDYVLALEAISGCRISSIGVGPERDQIVSRHDLLHARGA